MPAKGCFAMYYHCLCRFAVVCALALGACSPSLSDATTARDKIYAGRLVAEGPVSQSLCALAIVRPESNKDDKRENEPEVICSCHAIGQHTIVTAAHCLYEQGLNAIIQKGNLYALFGQSPYTRIVVNSLVRPEEHYYSGGLPNDYFSYDIAVGRLARSINEVPSKVELAPFESVYDEGETFQNEQRRLAPPPSQKVTYTLAGYGYGTTRSLENGNEKCCVEEEPSPGVPRQFNIRFDDDCSGSTKAMSNAQSCLLYLESSSSSFIGKHDSGGQCIVQKDGGGGAKRIGVILGRYEKNNVNINICLDLRCTMIGNWISSARRELTADKKGLFALSWQVGEKTE